jgi:type IV pilus assembly protein PilV
MKQHLLSNQEGFGILDVLIALTIFTVAILALAQLQLSSLKGNALSRQRTEASYLAQSKLEELASLPYSTLVDDGSGNLDSTGADADGTETTAVMGTTYRISWNIDDDNPGSDMKMVRVIVTWQDGRSSKKLALTRIHCYNNI